MIQPEAVRYFLEISRTLNMSRAAERLGVTQPTLSHSLKRLEETLGHALFLRAKRGLQLTPAGGRFAEKANDLLQSWEGLVQAVEEEVDGARGLIRVGCHTAVAQYTLPAFLPEFLSKNPDVAISLAHGLSRHMTEMVVSSKLDVAIVVNPKSNPDLVIRELAKDRVTVWTPTGCLNEDVLFVEPDLLQSQDILAKLQKRKVRFKRVTESSSLEVIAQLLNAKAGRAILPERVLKAFTTVKVQAVADAPIFEDRICVVYRSEFRKLKRGQIFLRSLQEAFRS